MSPVLRVPRHAKLPTGWRIEAVSYGGSGQGDERFGFRSQVWSYMRKRRFLRPAAWVPGWAFYGPIHDSVNDAVGFASATQRAMGPDHVRPRLRKGANGWELIHNRPSDA